MSVTVVPQSVSLIVFTAKANRVVERAGRVCYRSEGKLTCDCGYAPEIGQGDASEWAPCLRCDTRADEFCRKLIGNGHTSVLEHAAATVLVCTDRGVSHELVRHRVGIVYSQESTRYCAYGAGITVICPPGMTDEQEQDWRLACENASRVYGQLLASGAAPQIARSVLPTCTKTEIAVTANMRQWREVIRQRHLNRRAHPQIRELIGHVLTLFSEEPALRVFVEDLVKECENA